MEKHFNFGHTIKANITIQSSSQEDLNHLFQIGQAKIKMQRQNQESEGAISIDSDQTPQITKNKQQKKVKKGKHKKHHKNKEQKKQHKHKKKQIDKSKEQMSSQNEQNIVEKSLIPFKSTVLSSSLLSVYQNQIQKKSKAQNNLDNSEILLLSQKIGENLLQVDKMNFPQKELYDHGIMDREVPQYKRLPFFEHIIGGKNKKQKDIIQLISKKINQNQVYPYPDQISKHRYHQFQGYSNLQPQPLPYKRPLSNKSPSIKLGKSQSFTQSSVEQKWIQTTKQYNNRLNQDPKNISLWIEFIRIQPSLSTVENKTAIMQRQISIIQKALHLNPLNQQLGLLELHLLQQKHQDEKQLIVKCKKLIEVHPHNAKLWKLYLYLHLNQFSIFSYEYCRKIFEQLTSLLRKIIDQSKSALQLWKIRKAGLQLVKQQILLYKLQGYGQLATGVLIALIDFNFFMPEEVTKLKHQDKIKVFGEYWEDPQTFKLGQLNFDYGWNHGLTSKNHESFIGKLNDKHEPKQLNIYQKQFFDSKKAWRLANLIYDKQMIDQRPQSYVLMDDIDFGIQLYSDTQSLLSLIDLLADHLEFPTVFTLQGINSQFCFQKIEQYLNNLAQGQSYKVNSHDFYLWQRYWNPKQSQFLQKQSNYIKLEYFRRILNTVKGRIPQYCQIVNQYLIFISCCYYVNQDLRRIVNFTEEEVSCQIQTILSSNQLDVISWSIYIESCYLIKSDVKQCIDCYIQLVETARSLGQKIIFEVIYWFLNFVRRHCPQKLSKVLKVYLNFLDKPQFLNTSLQQQMIHEEQLRLERYLIQKLQGFVKQMNSLPTVYSINQVILPLLLLNCFELNFLKNIKDRKQLILELVYSLVSKNNINTQVKHFLIHQMVKGKYINEKIIHQKKLLTLYPSFQLIKYWFYQNKKPLICFLSDFQMSQDRNLALWMTLSIFIYQEVADKQTFLQYFYKLGKQLCFESRLDQFEAKFILLFNELLLFDTQKQHSEFIQYSLKKLPFCKQLYLLNLQLSKPQPQVKNLLRQKNIRILNTQIIQN